MVTYRLTAQEKWDIIESQVKDLPCIREMSDREIVELMLLFFMESAS